MNKTLKAILSVFAIAMLSLNTACNKSGGDSGEEDIPDGGSNASIRIEIKADIPYDGTTEILTFDKYDQLYIVLVQLPKQTSGRKLFFVQ